MKRILTALVLISLVVLLVLQGPIWLVAVFAAAVAGLAAHEYRELAQPLGMSIPPWWLYGSLTLLFGFAVRLPDLQLPLLTLLALVLLGWSGFRAPLPQVLPDTAAGLFGLVYVGYPLTLLPLIKAHEDGTGWLLFLFVTVWSGDIAALYVGRAFGRRKLAPRLSPGKTWAGAVASVIGSVGCGMALYFAGQVLLRNGFSALHIGAPAWEMALLAAGLNVAAQVGDLLESALKRGAGVKDSGTLLPGHGGVLDRIDALLLAAPALWYVLLLKDWQGLFR